LSQRILYMNPDHISNIARELGLKESQIRAVAELLEQDSTIPFISRYRKEATGNLDELAITSIRDRLKQLEALDHRKQSILKSLRDQGYLTDELRQQVLAAEILAKLEDIYLPYRPKRRTRAAIAKEKGLESLAKLILDQDGIDLYARAAEYINRENSVNSAEEALAGARDIIAEMINEDQEAREKIRHYFFAKAIIHSRVANGKETEGQKYRDYFDWQQPAAAAPSHRILAIRRGEKENILNLSIQPPEEQAIAIIENIFITGDPEGARQVKLAIHDCYKRLMSRSMETEIRLATKARADREAIKIFSDNLRQLLLAPPMGAKRVMGIDPGFRTGCKVVCLNRRGNLMQHDTVYPLTSDKKAREASDKILKLCKNHAIEAIAVGNGTAGRETEAFIKSLPLPAATLVVMVNESGASIYSASQAAREEFPDLDLTVRGAISIGRRLMDPLSELVKIDPKSIGVGQYQHDVDQSALKQSLDDVVMSCVNTVGVDLNQASTQLLTYVSGLGPKLAKNIVAYRNEKGFFTDRKQLLAIPKLGSKAYEQSAGFLRIYAGKTPLDASAVHPESYHVVDAMAKKLGCTVAALLNDSGVRGQIDISEYVTDQIGIPTLKDIMAELAQPGRDPREKFTSFSFANDIEKISDLAPGMKLPGIVTNVTAFGAFVDIGVHQDGLVHISELADRFVKNPLDIVRVHQEITVRVLDVDLDRNRISLSMKTVSGCAKQPPKPKVPKITNPQKKTAGRKNNMPFHNPFKKLLDQS